MILCSFRNLNLSFGPKVLFKDAQLSITNQDRIGLLGLNGQGKSTLFKILALEMDADISTPPFQFDRSNKFSLFYIPQSLPESLEDNCSIDDIFWHFYPQAKTLNDQLLDINKSLEQGVDSEDILNKQAQLLEKLEHLNIWEQQKSFESFCKSFGLLDFTAPIKNFSGGEQKKILLSLGLSSTAKLILWDEPTNHLDLETIRHFENELQMTQNAYILVSHDRYLLGKCTNKIFQINNKEVISFDGGYQDFLVLQAQQEKERLVTLQRLKNSFRREDSWMKQGIRARGTRSKKRVENYEGIKGQISELKARAKKELSLSIHSGQKKSKQLVQASDVNFSYNNERILFKGLNFAIKKGDRIGILGQNGTGKSTLISLINQSLKPTHGAFKLAPDISIKTFSQKRVELDIEKSPFELLGDGTDQVSLPGGKTEHVMSYFKRFLFNQDEIHRPISTFSGGERSRLQLALNLKKGADIWIFDEPTNDLDLETLNVLEKVLTDFNGSIILISHDRLFLKNITNRIFVIEDQNVEVFEGGYEQVESYLEAQSLEREIQKESLEQGPKEIVPQTSSTPKTKQKKTSKPNEVNEIERKIDELESLIEKIDQVLSQLSAYEANDENINKMTQLSEKKSKTEDELLRLYETIS